MNREDPMRRRAISLIEVLVTIAVVGLVFALVVPMILRSRWEGDHHNTCQRMLRNQALAVTNYTIHQGTFPPSAVSGPNHSWTALVLEDLDAVDLFNAYNFNVANYDVANSTVVRTPLRIVVCPNSPMSRAARRSETVRGVDGSFYPAGSAFAPSHYGANWGGGRLPGFGDDFAKTQGNYRGVMMPVGVSTPRGETVAIRPQDVVDGLSTTILLGEKRDSQGWAVGGYGGSEFDAGTSPQPPDRPDVRTVVAGSFHLGSNVAFADGSVRAVFNSIDRKVWYALLTRDGGEAVSRDDY